MWEEHRKWNETLKSGGVVHTETSAERWQVLEAIPERIQGKFKDTRKGKSTYFQIDLLVYLNISSQFSLSEVVHRTETYKDNFQSIWLLSGGNAVRVWPSPQQVLTAQHDPLE
jgi:hypothetical protein